MKKISLLVTILLFLCSFLTSIVIAENSYMVCLRSYNKYNGSHYHAQLNRHQLQEVQYAAEKGNCI